MRIFIAIEIPGDILCRISDILTGLKKICPDVRWVRPESIHLTLKFLGNVDPETLEDLAAKLRDIEGQKFDLSIGDLGAFPNMNYPRVVFLGLDGDTDILKSLQQDIEEKCASAGFEMEKRDFSPHLTLGRRKGGGRAEPPLHAALSKGIGAACIPQFMVDEVHIYESVLKPTGAEYRKLKSFALKGDEDRRIK